jgi:hypothetical protein
MRTAAVWLLGFVFFSLACSLTTPQTPATPTAVITPFPITPLPTATRNAGTPTPNPFASSPYDGCHDQRSYPPDFTLFPGETCADDQCVDAGLEADAYAAWKAEMMQVHQLTESSFAERIQLADVNANQSGNRVTVSIHFVVVNEWARTHQTDYMSFKKEPDAAMMAEEARMTVFEETQINLPQVATIETIEATFAACDPALAINWCTLDYPNFGGRLHVTAFREVDAEADLCMDAAVYVDTGELWYCRERPCMIDE